MKTKHFVKKLVLNKKTIAHLDNGEMKAIEGGEHDPPCKSVPLLTCVSAFGWSCPTCPQTGDPCLICGVPIPNR